MSASLPSQSSAASSPSPRIADVLYRSREEFLRRVNEEWAIVGEANPEEATRAVLSFLNQKVTEGEIESVRFSALTPRGKSSTPCWGGGPGS